MSLEDVLAAATVRPVVVGFLDFKDDQVFGWTGPGTFLPTGTGDPDLDGEAFTSSEGAVEITDFVENQELGGPVTVTFAAGDMVDEEIVQQLVADRRAFQGRRAKFWRFFLAADESSVLPEFDVLFNGVMVNAETRRIPGEGAIIQVVCDQDLQRARTPPVRWADHQVFYPTDTATSFVNDLNRGGIASAVQRRDPEYAPGSPRWEPRSNR